MRMWNRFGLDNKTELTDTKIKDFWGRVNKKSEKECWEWNNIKDKYGYGVFPIKRKIFKAHRVAYLIYKGDIDPTLCICHKCDNPSCVNPLHLFQGTQLDNIRDRVRKKRTKTGHLYGEDNKLAKLKKEDVIFIRKKYNPHNLSTRKLAKMFGVCQTNIRNILANKSWRWLNA